MTERIKKILTLVLVFASFLWLNPTMAEESHKLILSNLGQTVFAANNNWETTADVNLRKGPGTKYGVITVLKKGSSINVLSFTGAWAKVNALGVSGYVSTSYLKTREMPIMVTKANLNMRLEASTRSKVILVIPKGNQVKLISKYGGWAHISYNNSEGYCSLTYLENVATSPTELGKVYYTTDELNLREGPGTNYKIIAFMAKGSKVTALPGSGSWLKVTYQGKTGYAHGAYLTENLQGRSSKVMTKGINNPSLKQIALTFDGGWENVTTIPLLNVLDKYQIKATFFLRAMWVRDNPNLAKEIQKRGHSIQNHSLTHPHMREMSRVAIEKEFKESTTIFKEILGISPTLFRPPYGEYNDLVLDIAGQSAYPYTIMWSIDTIDWANSINGNTVDANFIINKVLSKVSNQDIVLMHIAYQKTVDALPQIIETLKERGYNFKTVPQMLP